MASEHDAYEDQMRQQTVDTLLVGKPRYDHVEFGIANQVPELMFHALLFVGVYWAFEEKDYNLRLLAEADEQYGPDFSSWSDWLAYSYTTRYGQRRAAFRLAFEDIGAGDLVDLFIEVYDRAQLGNGLVEYEEGALRWRYVLNDLDRLGAVEVEASGLGDLPKGTWYEETDPQNLQALGDHLRVVETMKLVAAVYVELLDAAFDPAGTILRGMGNAARFIGGLRMYFAARKGRPVRRLSGAPRQLATYGEKARITFDPPPQQLVRTGVPKAGDDMARVRVIDGPRRDAMIIDGDTLEVVWDPNVPAVTSKAVDRSRDSRILSEKALDANKATVAAVPVRATRALASAGPTVLATIPGRYRDFRYTVEIIDSAETYKGVAAIRARITFDRTSFPSARADDIADAIRQRYTMLDDEIAAYVAAADMPPVILPPGTAAPTRSRAFKSGHAENIPGSVAHVDETLPRAIDGVTHDGNQLLLSAEVNGLLGNADTRIITWARTAWQQSSGQASTLPGTVAVEQIMAVIR